MRILLWLLQVMLTQEPANSESAFWHRTQKLCTTFEYRNFSWEQCGAHFVVLHSKIKICVNNFGSTEHSLEICQTSWGKKNYCTIYEWIKGTMLLLLLLLFKYLSKRELLTSYKSSTNVLWWYGGNSALQTFSAIFFMFCKDFYSFDKIGEQFPFLV